MWQHMCLTQQMQACPAKRRSGSPHPGRKATLSCWAADVSLCSLSPGNRRTPDVARQHCAAASRQQIRTLGSVKDGMLSQSNNHQIGEFHALYCILTRATNSPTASTLQRTPIHNCQGSEIRLGIASPQTQSSEHMPLRGARSSDFLTSDRRGGSVKRRGRGRGRGGSDSLVVVKSSDGKMKVAGSGRSRQGCACWPA